LRVLHLIAGLNPQHGGPSYSVPRLCQALRELGVEARIFTIGESAKSKDTHVSAYDQDFANVPILRKLRFSSEFRRAVSVAAQVSDVIHVHGLWLMPNVTAGRAAAAANRPLIVSPRGMLAPEALAFSPGIKRIFWNWIQGPAYAKVAVWHATSEAEANNIRDFGIGAPIAIVPNGIDVPKLNSPYCRSNDRSRTILYLGRIHPKKGLRELVEAWARLFGDRVNWTLRIVGPDENGHREELKNIASQSGALRISFENPVYGEQKNRILQEADLFVLSTKNENFGLAVAEALAMGVPCIVSRGAPWSGLQTERCGWWVEQGVEPLLFALRLSTALSDGERSEMGQRGRAWMARDFGWSNLAMNMYSVYQWALGKEERPTSIHLD